MATIAPSMTAELFLRQVRESKLTEPNQLDAVLAKLPAPIKDGEDPKPLARALIEHRLLTKFQATLVLQGKARSLTVASKYRLIDRLGAGGMGLVYLCEHINLKRLVALKVMPQKSANDPGQRERFLREAQTAAALRHPNIVQAHDVDSDHGVFYFVMDYVDGIDLERLIAKKGPLDPVQACHYISQAAEGLQHAAEHGLVHRDIKPANLLIERGGGIKLLDLGLARFCDNTEGLTAQLDGNAVIGTADYIAPEQAINSSDVDTRADIYALGCTFYFLLAGRAPFKEANVTQKLLMHQMRDPIAITELRPEVPGAIGAILAKMIAKNPDHRYQSPIAIVQALAPWTQTQMKPLSESDLPSRFGLQQQPISTEMRSPSSTSTVSMSRGGGRGGSSIISNTARHRGQTIQIVRPVEDKNKTFKYVAVVGFGSAVIALAFWRPWINPEPINNIAPYDPSEVPVKVAAAPKTTATTPTPVAAPPAKLTAGVPYFALETGGIRPNLTQHGIRVTPTDVLFLSGNALTSHGESEKEFLNAIRNDFVGGKTSPILPYAVAALNGSKYPNTLISLDVSGGLRPLEWNDRDYLPVERIGSASKEDNVLIQNKATLPSGVREVNSLASNFSDVSAEAGGTILRLKSGTALFSGPRGARGATFGSGSFPIVLDFGGRTGYLSVTSGDSFYVGNDPYDYTLRAKLTGLENEPLIVSGMGNTILRLDNNESDFGRLIIQGAMTPTTLLEQQFRVSFSDARQLGRPDATVSLSDAILSYVGTTPISVNRTLSVGGKQGRVAVGPQTPLTWAGKVTGSGRIAKSGGGILVLSNPGNDHKGGTDVSYGELVLQAPEGTPAGLGQVAIATNSILSGTGRIPGQLTVYPNGTLRPGSDGQPLWVNELALMRGRPPGVTEGDFPCIFHANLTGESKKLLIHAGKKTIDLNNALLRVETAANFKPTNATQIFLLAQEEGASPMKGTFIGLSQSAQVKTVDGAWTAKVSYEGNAATGAITGGHDVVLYDWTPGSK
jgi:autotransporter-associated beta strand protein